MNHHDWWSIFFYATEGSLLEVLCTESP